MPRSTQSQSNIPWNNTPNAKTLIFDQTLVWLYHVSFSSIFSYCINEFFCINNFPQLIVRIAFILFEAPVAPINNWWIEALNSVRFFSLLLLFRWEITFSSFVDFLLPCRMKTQLVMEQLKFRMALTGKSCTNLCGEMQKSMENRKSIEQF